MTFTEFSNKIIETNDIDPDYIFLINYKKHYGEEDTFELVKKKLLIYNLHSELLYHDKLIDYTQLKFGNERQKNKRHFLEWQAQLSKIGLEKFRKFNGVDYLIFRHNFKKIKGMGDWASWKTADILEKVFDIKMKFDDFTFLNAYQFPLKGLLMINNRRENVAIYKDKSIYLKDYYNAKSIAKQILGNNIWDPNNVLELETLLCKYHSFAHKHYTVNNDLNKVRKIKEDKRLSHYHKLLP